MAEAISKRNLSQIQPVQTKRQEVLDKKTTNKPGRKPINSEPKNKRTAQNRAAQRAFRERKEQKMKELEEKVKELENEKKAANTESEFLRIQVEMLSSELSKYKGSNFDVNSLKLDKKMLENYKQQSSINSVEHPSSVSMSSESSDSHTRNSSNISTPATAHSKQTFEFPWSNLKSNYNTTKNSSASVSESSNSYKGENSLSPGSDIASSGDSPSSNNIQKTISKSNDATNNTPVSQSSYNFNKDFDEQVFCNTLGLACGTKDKPVPKYPSKSIDLAHNYQASPNNQITALNNIQGLNSNNINKNNNNNSNFSSLFSTGIDASYDPNMAFDFSDSSKLLDDLDFLKDPNSNTYRDTDSDNFGLFGEEMNDNPSADDLNLANFDPINQLTTDESAYDPFEINVTSTLALLNDGSGAFNNSNIVSANTVPGLSPPGDGSIRSGSMTSFSKYINSNPAESSVGSVRGSANGYPRNSSKSSVNTPITPAASNGYIAGLNTVIDDNEDDANVMVPSKESKLIKCSEIWDRVTSHPKYTDLDIDGLCSELRSKAKCSEKGVVLDTDDLESILNRSA